MWENADKTVGNFLRPDSGCGELQLFVFPFLSYAVVVKIYPQLIPLVVVQEYAAGGSVLRYDRVVR